MLNLQVRKVTSQKYEGSYDPDTGEKLKEGKPDRKTEK